MRFEEILKHWEKEKIIPIKLSNKNKQRIGYMMRSIFSFEEGVNISQITDMIINDFENPKILTVLSFRKDNGWVIVVDSVCHLFPPFDKILEKVVSKKGERK
jgi:hypothetical protein